MLRHNLGNGADYPFAEHTPSIGPDFRPPPVPFVARTATAAAAIADLERGGYDLVRVHILPTGIPILRPLDAVDPALSALLTVTEYLDFAAVRADAVPPGLGILRKRRFRRG